MAVTKVVFVMSNYHSNVDNKLFLLQKLQLSTCNLLLCYITHKRMNKTHSTSGNSELHSLLAEVEKRHQYGRLHHGITSAGRKQFLHRLHLGALHGWTQHSRPKHCRQVLQRHLVLGLVFSHAANSRCMMHVEIFIHIHTVA